MGITIDQNLQFNIQTDNINNKANRALGALERAAPFLAIDTRALYNVEHHGSSTPRLLLYYMENNQ